MASSLTIFQRAKLSTLSITHLRYLGFQCLDHPPYSLDLAPSDYHLFPELKKQMKGRHFSSDMEVNAAAEIWLDVQTSEFF
jgi:histone-lysine N-methyltransferase SETMAR